jgi:hypothetical protein
MPRFNAPLFVLTLVLAGCATTQAAPSVGSSSASAAAGRGGTRAQVQLAITGGPAEGSYDSTPTSPLALCVHGPDGSWRVQYAGTGTTLDVFLAPRAGEPGHASDVALEIDADDGYFWIDPAGLRGSGTATDPAGRSSVTADVRPAAEAATFVIAATSPYKSRNGDGPTAKLALTVVCPL